MRIEDIKKSMIIEVRWALRFLRSFPAWGSYEVEVVDISDELARKGVSVR